MWSNPTRLRAILNDEARATMKKTILFLLLAGERTDITFSSNLSQGSEVETALRSQTDFREARN